MVDVVRGTIRVRKWPKKRGKPRSEAQRFWVDWFKQANLLAKYADAASQTRAIEATKGSGWYPRDVLLKAMRGRLYWWTDQTGWKWFPVAAIGDISLALDVLGQTVGDILVRATDRWRPPPAGVGGNVLTHQGPGASPIWADPSAGVAFGGGCLLTRDSFQIIPHAVMTPLSFNQEVYDTGDYHDNAVNPTRITVPADKAWARFTASVRWSGSGTGVRIIDVLKNGTWFPGHVRQENPNADGVEGQSISSPIVPVVDGDYFEAAVLQTSGGDLTAENVQDLTNFSVQFFN